MTYKTGRRPAKNAPSLALASFLKVDAAVPPRPASEDYFKVISDWQMLGNDQYGDCVAVTAANERHAINKILGGKSTYASLDQVISFYKTQNPNFPSDDNGMEIQTALETLVKTGDKYFDGVKPVAFAKVDHTNLDEVKSALAVFGMLWVGLTVLDANMTEFNNGQPWDYVANSPVDGGHSVVAGGYRGQSANDVQFITWAAETGFTDSFWTNLVEEAWVVIWPEQFGTAQFEAGVDVNALAAAYLQLTGKVLPVPAPAPTPTPTPVPTPVPVPTPTGDSRTFTAEQINALDAWARHPHYWHLASVAAKAWDAAQ